MTRFLGIDVIVMNRFFAITITAFFAALALPAYSQSAPPAGPAADHALAASFADNGTIQSLTWKRPGSEPVDLVFRQDRFAGFSFHVKTARGGEVLLPLARVQPGREDFALNQDGINYSLAYAVKEDRLEVVAQIKNESGQPFSPARVWVNVGVDTEMAKFPEWNQRFFPTLLRCEKTHFWGYFMRPDGIILGIASPDPIASWANDYNGGGHRIFTSCLDLLNQDPQPSRHPQVNPTLAPGESRRWKICLVPDAHGKHRIAVREFAAGETEVHGGCLPASFMAMSSRLASALSLVFGWCRFSVVKGVVDAFCDGGRKRR